MSEYKLRLEIEMAKLQIQQQIAIDRYRLGWQDPRTSDAGRLKPRCMSKRCVSCGAPPETTTTVCSCCGTQEKQ